MTDHFLTNVIPSTSSWRSQKSVGELLAAAVQCPVGTQLWRLIPVSLMRGVCCALWRCTYTAGTHTLLAQCPQRGKERRGPCGWTEKGWRMGLDWAYEDYSGHRVTLALLCHPTHSSQLSCARWGGHRFPSEGPCPVRSPVCFLCSTDPLRPMCICVWGGILSAVFTWDFLKLFLLFWN